MMSANQTQTIVAIATPAGQGGVGIIRLSGPQAIDIGEQLTHKHSFKPRFATYCSARDANSRELDQGVALTFIEPHSFTGEDVFEFQGHGSPVVMRLLVQRCIELGARMARPGEFSERAFLNEKLDLVQAEAIADLIESQTEASARAALRSLRGDFSQKVQAITDEVIALRVFVEAAIDFPEEEIDFLEEHDVQSKTQVVLDQFTTLAKTLRRGVFLRDAVKVVLVGPPNAGKSSILNALSREDRAIVSDIPGTTRDVLEQSIQIDGLPVLLSDTAGLRDSADAIEQEGIKRARKAMQAADFVLICVDDNQDDGAVITQIISQEIGGNADASADLTVCVVYNKIDLSSRLAGQTSVAPLDMQLDAPIDAIAVSAITGEGIDALTRWIQQQAGFGDHSEGQVLARQRHLDALARARGHVESGLAIYAAQQAGELLAEELLLAQKALGEITGEFSSDDLLGEIFGSFCIGK